ncbi:MULTISPECIES: hypothetical protein [unclassified Coleofasciculus]|uniref:hypothetical protein n=1 Tax=unclassified Coleofasciculus TaxID=2692782 RepID=UPI001882AF36|nr:MULTISPECIES: hypothetical protein [unclassified Coleofasciculus]MBE9126541.1 hypothetical protein [Coleofasciculus sp. LEGE 07081]MBE9149975.1 hypothetical protein [Coleofasciculus sp. LEGE 07092]
MDKSEMNFGNNFEHQIQSAQEWLISFNKSVHNSQTISPELQEEALAELAVILEELHQQNEELCRTRGELEFEQQRYQELFEYAPDGYLVTDLGALFKTLTVQQQPCSTYLKKS